MPTTPRQSSTAAPATASGPSLAAARALLKSRQKLDALMAKLVTARERTNVQQHLDALRGAGNDAHAKLWERVATALFTLAPELPRFAAQKAMQFSLPDGKYKLQVLAFQDTGTGIQIYCPDVLDQAVAVGLVKRGKAGERPLLGGTAAGLLPIDELADSGVGQKLPEVVRPMLGWGKKALSITLPADATEAQVGAVEELVALAALKWRQK